MKKNSKKSRICKSLAIAMTLFLNFGSMTAYAEGTVGTPSPPVNVTLYHTNDMHGALAGTNSCIGVDKVAALKEQTPNSILVDAGDATQGLPLASLSKGADIIDIMNVAGYDVMAAGNHEFDYGSGQLFANASRAVFPILAANIANKNTGKPFLDGTMTDGSNTGCHTIIEVSGVKIGFFGLTTCDTKTATNPAGITDVEFKDEIATTQEEINELLAEDVDAIVAIAHLGEYTNVPCDSAKLAEAMTGSYQGKLDVIIDGHSHTVEDNRVVNDVLIQQTGTGLTNLGKVELTVSPDSGVSSAAGSILTYNDISVEPKAEVTAKIAEIEALQNETMSERICDVSDTLWGGYVDNVAVARITETNLGGFAADAFQHAAKQFLQNAQGMENYQDLPVLAVENGGGLRASLSKGTRTLGDLVTVFPFSNTLMMKEVTPQILYEVLELSVSSITGQDGNTGMLQGQPSGGFLQIGGFSFSYNPSAPQGSKVENVYVDGNETPLARDDNSTRLIFVSNNFIMNGGNGYDMLGSLPLIGEIGGELETLQEYINLCTSDGTVALAPENVLGRIHVNGEYAAAEYKAFIQLTNTDTQNSEGITTASDNSLANRQVSLYVDNSDVPVSAITNEQGVATLTLPNGPHSISGSDEPDSPQIYVNNYMGAGISEDTPLSLAYSGPAIDINTQGNITFTVPSDQELTITSGRSFYVQGAFQDLKIPENSKVSVSVVDKNGTVFRNISSDIKGNTSLKTDMITYGTDENLENSGMPDLIWDGVNDDSFHDGNRKCYYNDSQFTALIPGGATANSIDDKMGWIDSTTGKPYTALPDGAYTIQVQVESAGQLLAAASKEITIGNTSNKILARFSPATHKNRITEFANAGGLRIYNDPFPGYWSASDGLFCEIAPEWRAADATEYTTGKVHFVIYNVRDTSTTYGVELGLLQKMGDIDKPDRLVNYYYTTGEPEKLNGVSSDITAFQSGDKLQFVRAELSTEESKDGIYNQDTQTSVNYDMNVYDGVTVKTGESISLFGVTAPIQIEKTDLIENGDNTFTMKNKIQTVKYHITGDGVDKKYEKEVKLNRISGDKDNYSELEFKHVLPVTKEMSGKTLTVEVNAYDAHGNIINGGKETLKITVDGNTASKTDTTNSKTSKTPQTGDETSIVLLLAVLLLSGAVIGRKLYIR